MIALEKSYSVKNFDIPPSWPPYWKISEFYEFAISDTSRSRRKLKFSYVTYGPGYFPGKNRLTENSRWRQKCRNFSNSISGTSRGRRKLNFGYVNVMMTGKKSYFMKDFDIPPSWAPYWKIEFLTKISIP